MSPLVIFIILSFLSITRAEYRSHGLASEAPMAISPQTYAFFHPDAYAAPPTTANSRQCHSSNCKTLPLAATVKSTPAQESTATSDHRRLGAGGIAAISLSFVFVCVIGMGVYYATIKRRANLRRSNGAEQTANA